MGSDSCSNISIDKLHAEQLENWTSEGKSSKVIMSAITGDPKGYHKLWVLKEINTGARQFRLIVVTCFEGYGRSWTWRTMDEGMHPYHYQCPYLLVANAWEPYNESSRRWRNNVARFHCNINHEDLVFEAFSAVRNQVLQ